MKKRAPLTDADGEVRELDAEDIRRLRPACEVLPEQVRRNLGIRTRGPQRTPTKIPTTIRLSPACAVPSPASPTRLQPTT